MQALVQALVAALQALMGAVSIGPDEGPEAYLPTQAKLKARLNDPAVRQSMVTDYLAEVQGRWQRADAAGLIAKLGRVRTEHAKMKSDPGTVKPIPHLPQNDVAFFFEHLATDNTNESGGRANKLGRDLVLGTRTVAQVTGTADEAVRAIMNLRRLDDLLTRILSASAVSQATMTPIAEVLALYRVEGDMNAPPSTASLTRGIPSGTQDAISIVNPAPNLRHLVFLAGPGATVGSLIDFSTATDAEIREFALAIWCLQIGGLDVVAQLPRPWRNNFAAWSAQNWTAAGYPVGTPAQARQAAEQRWDQLVNNMDVARPHSGASQAVMVTPANPSALVTGILQEAVMLQRAMGKAERLLGPGLPAPLAGTELTRGMAYLFYHAGDQQSHHHGQTQALLTRAMLAAFDAPGVRYGPLRSAILNDMTVASHIAQLRPVKKMSHAAALPVLRSGWPKVQQWLRQSNHLDLLSDFVESVDGNVWSSWTEHRGNLSRYNLLLDYYRRVMA
ncbi:MAG: hypothetical protein ACOY93_14155 [Bacillota bacterium]